MHVELIFTHLLSSLSQGADDLVHRLQLLIKAILILDLVLQLVHLLHVKS